MKTDDPVGRAVPEHLRIDLLGRFRLMVDGAPVRDAISLRGREVLTLLVLEGGQRTPRERIASRLWPESSEAQARTNLRREIHHLRHELPLWDEALDASGGHLRLCLDEGVASDVHDFRAALARADSNTPGHAVVALAEAARCYGGDLVPESFAEWLTIDRERLRVAVVATLRRLIALLEERRDLIEAIRWARRLTEIDPLDEIAYRAQMRLHAAAGDRPAALHAFHRCANLLERELGVTPAAETRALYRTLVGSADEAPSEVVAPMRQTPEASALVGREAVLARLIETWRQADGPRLVCILGEPGIGKSRLASALAREAERDGTAAPWARAYAAEGPLSYAPVVDWLRSPAVFPRLGDLDTAWRCEIGRLLPELPAATSAAEMRDVTLNPGGDDAYPRRRLFEAIARALLGDERPMMLVLDDVQWCDPETLALVHYLSRYRTAARVLVVATARTAELADNQAAQRLLLALRQEGALLEIELGPLDAPGMTDMLRAAAGADEVSLDAAERLYQLSEGNPLFALEAMRAGLHDSSAAALLTRSARVRAVLAARLAQLAPRALELAHCAATIGRAFSFEVLREAADLDEAEIVPALDELWRRRIVREHPRLGYDFSHDALREAVAREVSPARARLLHRRVAQALELINADALDEVSASVATHYERADVPERAIAYFRRAARAAAAVHAHRRATALLERALELVSRRSPSLARDREELALLLAQAPSLRAMEGYTAPALLSVLQRARALAERVEDVPASFETLRNLWGLHFVEGDVPRSLEIATRLRELAASRPELAAESHHATAGALTHLPDLAAALEHFAAVRRSYDPQDARHRLYAFGSDLGVFNSAWESHALWLSGFEDRAVAAARDAVRRARELRHAYSEALAQAYVAVLHYMRRDRVACAEAADAARELCERHGFAYYRHWGVLLGAWARLDSDAAAAVSAIERALKSLDEERAFARRSIYLAALTEALAAAGEPGLALRTLDQAEARAEASGDHVWDAELSRLRAVLDPPNAVALARRALDQALRQRARSLAVRCAVTLALAMHATGEASSASRILRELLAELPDAGGSHDRSRALAVLATLG